MNDEKNIHPEKEGTAVQKDDVEETSRIEKAIAHEIENVTAAIPPLPLTGLAGEAAPGRPFPEDSPVRDWFFTFMCMNIPIVGWIYLLRLTRRKTDTSRRNFARAYLFYKLVFLAVSAVLLGILIWIGLDMLDHLLAYMEML
ncbi:MAG: hypothetical protein Q4C73_12115 [Eubacteriales bacterium]|nr:hypothetical protein [Eubacteriales bacterium]